MPGPISFTPLRPGGSDGLILACDFPATGRTVAGFADLVSALPPADSVWETSQPPAAEILGDNGADFLELWLADVRKAAVPVTAVLGFCVGSVFAAELAARVAAIQGETPKTVLFDPERPDADLVHRHYREAVGGLSLLLSDSELTAAQEAGLTARQKAEDLTGLAAELTKLLGEFGRPAFERTGLAPRRSAELVDVFAAFLAYLVAAAEFDPRPVWAGSTAISSATPHSGLNPLPADERAVAVAHEITFDVPHTDLLRDHRVGQAVSRLLS
jgi:hypothetical protein